jgi:hypothetical protein
LNMPAILRGTFSGTNPSNPGEFDEKLHTMLALYDGSYFYRLMNVGGMFERMYSEPAGWLPIFGFTLLIAGVVCVVMRIRGNSDKARIGLFLVAAIALATLGVFLLPGAVRVHHAILVYPLPQLIIALAVNILLNGSPPGKRRIVVEAVTWMVLLGLLLSQALAIQRTQKGIRETGGRGRWSERIDAFCRENKDRTDLTIVSLDWGFNEQMVFLTQGPQLAEPFWRFGRNPPPLPTLPHYLYLVYPSEYSLFPFGEYYLKEARAKGSEVEIRPYLDRQDHIAFYSIQYLGN